MVQTPWESDLHLCVEAIYLRNFNRQWDKEGMSSEKGKKKTKKENFLNINNFFLHSNRALFPKAEKSAIQ